MAENYADFGQIVKDLIALNQNIEEIRQSIVSKSEVTYDSQDARHVALDGIQCMIAACGMWMNALTALKDRCEKKYGTDWEREYLNSIGTALPMGKAEDCMLDYLRNTLTTAIHFKIENLFKNILNNLDSGYNERGFWRIGNDMLQKAGLPTNGTEKEILTALANLRNSYHANGMHANEDLTVCIDGHEFEFRKGKRVKCASWLHIIAIIRANVDILEPILSSDKVSEIKHEIIDEFASQGDDTS